MFIYHVSFQEYETPEDLQHYINSWVKLGFQCINIKWIDNKPEFNVVADIDNATIRLMINELLRLIREAHENENFDEVLKPYKLGMLIKAYDIDNQTDLFNKYLIQLQQLEKYINDKNFFNQPLEEIKKSTKETIIKDKVLTTNEKELISIGPRRKVNNQNMIPAIIKHVTNEEPHKIQELKRLYPQVFKSSYKYLGKKIQRYLQEKVI